MIYAMPSNRHAKPVRLEIAKAIRDGDVHVIRKYVKKEVIIHVMDAPETPDAFCIYCLDQVFPSNARPPRGLTAKRSWHYEHRRNGHCIGRSDALGVLNPRRHGCYVLLGCETVRGRSRKCCQCIRRGQTYCHLAANHHCV